MTKSARNSGTLESLAGVIHDHWFPLDAIVFDGNELRIPLSDEPLRRASADSRFPWTLIIRNVESWFVRDEAEVGYYDVAELFYDAARGAVTLKCGLPLEIEVLVGNIDVTLQTA